MRGIWSLGSLADRVVRAPTTFVVILTKVNRGEMRIWEQGIRSLIETGVQMEVRITLRYEGTGGVPIAIVYEYRVHNARVPWTPKIFPNQ